MPQTLLLRSWIRRDVFRKLLEARGPGSTLWSCKARVEIKSDSRMLKLESLWALAILFRSLIQVGMCHRSAKSRVDGSQLSHSSGNRRGLNLVKISKTSQVFMESPSWRGPRLRLLVLGQAQPGSTPSVPKPSNVSYRKQLLLLRRTTWGTYKFIQTRTLAASKTVSPKAHSQTS